MKFITATAACAALVLGVSAAHADTTISTLPFWDGSSFISTWGGGATNTYGEVFTAPGGALTSFTFEVNDEGSPANFIAEVYAWNGSVTGGAGPQGTGGPALYTSGPLTTSGDGLFDAITINTGGVALTTGQNYVIDLYDASGDGVAGGWGDTQGGHPGVAGDGGFNFNNGPSNAAVWDDFGDFGSLAYSATFAGSVPEPSSWALMLLGFGALGAAVRGRKGATAPA
jgi:hypothetical protein